MQAKLHDVEMSLRGILRGFGLKVGQDHADAALPDGSRSWSAGHATLEVIAEALLAVRAVLLREFTSFEKRVRTMARHDDAGAGC